MTLRRPAPSIRNILLILVGMLALLITVQAVRSVWLEGQHLDQVVSLRRASYLGDNLFAGMALLLVERDVAVMLLRASKPDAVKSLRKRLKDSRIATDEAFRATLETLDRYRFSSLQPMQQDLTKRLSQVETLRERIDRELAQPLQRRDRLLAGRWFDETSALLNETQVMWSDFIRRFTGIDPVVTQHLRYKHLLRVITDYTGRERALIGRLIIDSSDPSPAEFASLLRGQGTIDMAWEMSQLLAEQSGLYGSIGLHFKDARSHYLNLSDMIRNIFYRPGTNAGGTYPIGADLWLELSTQASESLDALKAVSVVETQRYIDMLEAKARHAIILHSLFLLLALALCVFSFRLIVRRVIQPIDTIVKAMVSTMEGRTVEFHLPAWREDEIGKLTEVLGAFRAAGDRYRALVDASSQITWTWQPGDTGQLDALKEWWEKTTGRPGTELLPRGWLEAVHPEDRDRAGKTWAEASARGENFELEYRVSDKTGGWRWVTVRGVALKGEDGAVREFVGSLNDITQRKEDEQALTDSSNRLQAVFNTVLDGLITIDRRAIIQSFNAAAERIFGYKAQEVIGQNVKMLMPEPYHSDHDGYVGNYLRTGEAKVIGVGREVAAKRRDGSVFPMELGISEFAIGRERAFVGIIRDISARKAAEAELLSYTQALERSNKELDDFAYIASHDLKEPLRGIHNHSRFLLEDNADKLDKDSVDKLSRLVYLSQRMERLVNDLLYFSRLGRQELAVQPTDLGEAIRDIEKTLELFLSERGAKIIVPEKLPVITCDKPRVTELLRNLITNAVKYNDKSERTVEIGCVPVYVSPQKGRLENAFYVRDNGKGIAPEFHEEIFRIFKRLQKDGAEEGTGVGLTFVKKIVERHGGKICLESEPGKGTTFYFTLEGAYHATSKAA